MKTKSVPVIIMLLAGAVACILGFIYQYETTHFFTMVSAVLVIFYLLGCIVKIILDKNFPEAEEVSKEENGDSEEVKENIESDSETKSDE